MVVYYFPLGTLNSTFNELLNFLDHPFLSRNSQDDNNLSSCYSYFATNNVADYTRCRLHEPITTYRWEEWYMFVNRKSTK